MSALLDYDTYVETDYSRFDMTISREWLELVQNPLLKMYFPTDALFHQALDMSVTTRGVSVFGLVYNIQGTRCSGDAHTSIGNGLLNAFNTYLLFGDLMTESEHPNVRAFHEGDDGVIALSAKNAHLADRVHSLNLCGFVIKSIVTRDINSVSFCGRFLYEENGRLKSYCDPIRTLAKLHTTLSSGPLRKLLLAKCMSYAHTDGHTPIIGAIVQTIRDQLRHLDDKFVRRAALTERYIFYGTRKVEFKFTHKHVRPACRAAFCIRTGISPTTQIQLEEYYSSIFAGRIPASFEQVEFGQTVSADDKAAVVHFMPTLHSSAR
jgi:hypothetical protein